MFNVEDLIETIKFISSIDKGVYFIAEVCPGKTTATTTTTTALLINSFNHSVIIHLLLSLFNFHKALS